MTKTVKSPDLQLAFDVGHSSIGWAVLQSDEAQPPADKKSATDNLSIDILGCGAVTFRADDCLASARRGYRRQRRHIRSTRQRITRMKLLFIHLGLLGQKELDQPGCAWPWQLAARVLSSKTGSNPSLLLTMPELWDVLRWYAHNRGYDGNRRWSAVEAEAQKEDSEKEANARTLMAEHGTGSMAETFCAVCGIDPLGKKRSTNLPGDKRPKGQNAAFPREIVEAEVRHIVRAHFGRLQGLDERLEKALMEDWQAVPYPEIKLPRRYQGGLLFGQLVPRFDNRIISKCPVSGEKVPSRNCPEFLNFRWAMQLANVRVARLGEKELSPLTASERKQIDAQMRQQGNMGVEEFKKHVRHTSGAIRDNLETMFMHPDAKEALLLDPVQKLVQSHELKPFWALLPERLQKRTRGKWRRGKPISLCALRKQLAELGGNISAFDAEMTRQLDAANTKSRKKDKQLTAEDLLNKAFFVKRLDQRAAFSRNLLKKAFQEVLAGKHPKEEGGCLFVTEKMRQAQMTKEIAKQTNNHLVRHRLLILERLVEDIIKEFAGGSKTRVARITIEVNRDLREMSGMTAKQKAQDLGRRIANHHHVVKKLEEDDSLMKVLENRRAKITAGLIRKARVADDLEWMCPYTGQRFEPVDLLTKRVDKDHIVPRSDRASDSLDSLVITFSAINKWKGKRTAWQFVEQEQGKPVPDLANLSIISLSRYKQLVESLETFKGHDDDKRRKKKRRELMLLPTYEEKEFTPRDLTTTSQLVRLGAMALRKAFMDCKQQPVIVSLPGSVTGTVRKAWRVLGCLGLACPQIFDETGEVKKKDEIRDITHLHHALDACVLGLAAYFMPNSGHVWELIVKRNPSDAEKRELMALGVFGFNAENRFEMRDLDHRLKEEIRQRLAEKRVVQHIPADMNGMPTKETVWRIFDPTDVHKNSRRIKNWLIARDIAVPKSDDSVVLITRRKRRGTNLDNESGGKVFHETKTWSWVYDEVAKSKVLGFDGASKKLRDIKGGKLIEDNFGMALYPNAPKGDQFRPIRFFKVWQEIQKLPKSCGGRTPDILRRGQLIKFKRGKYAGGPWRVLGIEENGKIRFFAPDFTRRHDDPQNHERVMVTSLLRDGIEILKTPLTGIPFSSTISSE